MGTTRKRTPQRAQKPRRSTRERAEPPPIAGVNPAAADHLLPEQTPAFLIAAVGASAGGLEAFTEFLAALPKDSGIAYVLIQHLMPGHDSMLSEILARATAMAVTEVENNMRVAPDNVYVIPPGKSMVLSHGLLQLSPRTEVKGIARPIDHFMRSLAEEQGHKSVGIVLSGTGNDGTLGLQEIKAAGGLTFAQDATASQYSMPSNAIAGGAVDIVLPADEIARELARIAAHPYVSPGEAAALPVRDSVFVRIVDMLAKATDVDFTAYKKNTLYRRIARRMMVRRIAEMADYEQLLRGDPEEMDSLYQDVLINVTSFFRNPEAYEAIKESVFPRLAGDPGRPPGEIRVWALGCSTGEEAYSIAMAFTEFLETTRKRIGLQVFATDLNSAGIEKARAGLYSKGIEQDVSPARLRRFFVEVDGGYRIAKPIRDMCVFARQNVITDPPFSRIDLVACRNMLIYLEPGLQKRLIPLLHFALRPNGFLWLGGSETIGTYRDLFDLVDARNKIYAKKHDGSAAVERPASSRPGLSRRKAIASPSGRLPGRAIADDLDTDEATDRLLLERYAPAAVVVDSALDILQYRGDTAPYLTPARGKASLSLLKMLRENLVVPVRGALHRAREDGRPVRVEKVRVKSSDGWREVDIVAAPLGASTFVVLFEEGLRSREQRAKKLHAEADSRIDQGVRRNAPAGKQEEEISRLSQELAATREYLQSVIESQEAASEELQSANEEVQSTNEELQSVNEELETSKEEIQASNEELATLNQELSNRNQELAGTNNDLVNLMGSVQMSIVMVGPDLRVRRFTAMAERNMNLVAADVGRSLSEIRTNLRIDDLPDLVAEVIDAVEAREREVQDRDGRWYSLRIRPYRTLENRIDGAVMLLVDIDELKRTQFAVVESERRFRLLADSAPVLIWVSDAEGMRFVNRAFEAFVGAIEHDIRIGDPAHYVHPDDRAGYLAVYQRALAGNEKFEARFRLRRADGAYRWVKSIAVPSLLPDGTLAGLVGCTFDITEMAQATLREFDRGREEFLAMLAHELRNPLAAIRNASRLLGLPGEGAEHPAARGIIERQSANMSRMVDELLDVARVTHGKIKLTREAIDLADLVRRVIATGRYSDRGRVLEASLPEAPVHVNGDALRLEQVVTNLLDNAVKFTRSGGHLWVNLEREAVGPSGGTPPREFATLRVRDDGVGIDRALLPHVFELFTQAEPVRGQERVGIGLGLALAKGIVELHGGTLAATSAGGALGSEFVMRLPMSQRGAAKARRAGLGPATPRAKRRILVVDDDEDSAASLQSLLEVAGHEVDVAHDGESALKKAALTDPSVILLDIALPDMDGYEVARRLRATSHGAGATIIATTGFGRQNDLDKSREAGIDHHLVKPLDFDALADILDRGGT